MSRQSSGFNPKRTTPQQAEWIAAIGRLLDDDAQLTELYTPKYLALAGHIRSDIRFQNEVQERYWSSSDPMSVIQVATGGGKTIIAAFITKKHLELSPNGHIIYVCHSADILEQSREKYCAVMPDRIAEMGFVNQPTRERRVHFLTAQKFVNLVKSKDPVFASITNDTVHLTIDENHHYPQDDEARLVIFGEVERIAQAMFAARNKRVLGMTGTNYRMDGMLPLGKKNPDYTFTVQDAINEGVCPNIHGIQVEITVVPDRHKKAGEFYRIKMSHSKREAYLSEVATNMVEVYKRIPKQFCAFGGTVSDAYAIRDKFNDASGLGDKGIAVLLGVTPRHERNAIREALLAGELAGYVTCNVGAEGIDIPAIEVVHIIIRTSSTVRLAQMIGRGLRVHEDKKRCLVIDYSFRRDYIISGCVGFFEYGNKADSWLSKVCDGKSVKVGPVVVQKKEQEVINKWRSTRSLSEEEAWVTPVNKYVSPEEFMEFTASLNLDEHRARSGIKGKSKVWEAYCNGKLEGLPPRPDNIPKYPQSIPEYKAYFKI